MIHRLSQLSRRVRFPRELVSAFAILLLLSCDRPDVPVRIPELPNPDRVSAPAVALPRAGALQEFVALRFPAAPASVCCIRFEDHASAALKKHAIFWAVAGWGVLETNVLPDGGTSGVFAADSAGRIRYLFGTRETRLSELRAILTSEQLSPGDADPSALADLLSLVLLTDGNVFHSVVEGRLDIPSGDGYEIDWRELLPHWLAVRRPRWQTIGGEPALVFYTIGGWMHETTTLARHRVFLDLDSMIRLESDVLSTAVYSSLPLIEY